MTNLFETVTEEEFENAHHVETHDFCGTVTLTQEEQEWRELNWKRPHIETFPCNYCGHCPNPGKCVRSITCPRCWREAGHSCVAPNNPQHIAPYHEERWLEVRRLYGTWYAN